MKSLKVALIMGLAVVFMSAFSAQAATEIQWWHAMGGKLGEKVEEICKKFNNSQSAYAVKPVYKGNYTETMTSAIAAFRAKKQPHIVQVFEVGTASMMAAKGAIYPVHKLMADMGEPFDQDAYLQAVIGYYTTPDGKMLSMPFNSSTPVLYYNKTAFKKAGLDPNKPPKTWPELAAAAKKCMDAGVVKYGFSVGWQSWVLIENFSAWHNVPIGSKANGFAGIDTRFSIDSPLHIKHISTIAGGKNKASSSTAAAAPSPLPCSSTATPPCT
jgi:sn-glycerol 3-phosphate transport system substrate-binding protein